MRIAFQNIKYFVSIEVNNLSKCGGNKILKDNVLRCGLWGYPEQSQDQSLAPYEPEGAEADETEVNVRSPMRTFTEPIRWWYVVC